jgi:hypothetical protein
MLGKRKGCKLTEFDEPTEEEMQDSWEKVNQAFFNTKGQQIFQDFEPLPQ